MKQFGNKLVLLEKPKGIVHIGDVSWTFLGCHITPKCCHEGVVLDAGLLPYLLDVCERERMRIKIPYLYEANYDAIPSLKVIHAETVQTMYLY